MERNKEYLPENDVVSHEYDHLSKEQLQQMLNEIENENKDNN